MSRFARMRILSNGSQIPVGEIPDLELDDFLGEIVEAAQHGWRIAAWFGVPGGASTALYAVLAFAGSGAVGVMRSSARGRFPSITPSVPQAHLFEREIAESCGLLPDGHPWLKPVRHERPLSTGPGNRTWAEGPREPCVIDFFRVEGDEVHEVAVGPVHAGVIEPGHFRFQCHGETVFHLEIALGYQHRGIEASLAGGPHPRTLLQLEAAAGDTTVGHAQAYCMVVEALAELVPTPRGELLRGAAAELERLANHAGDLGALAGDVGYLPTMSYCGRIRGDFLNMTAILCGSRFGRGLLRPGGVGFDVGPEEIDELKDRLSTARRDLAEAAGLLWASASVMARFEGTGAVSKETTESLGLVGPAARAGGVDLDVRRDHPYGIYRALPVDVATGEKGDVYSRALIRWKEADASIDYLDDLFRVLPPGPARSVGGAWGLPADTLAVALTEGWRGRICHVALTDAGGRFRRYKVVDPSFLNWTGLAMSLRNGQISDFPLCNKSFNLSYCGFDL